MHTPSFHLPRLFRCNFAGWGVGCWELNRLDVPYRSKNLVGRTYYLIQTFTVHLPFSQRNCRPWQLLVVFRSWSIFGFLLLWHFRVFNLVSALMHDAYDGRRVRAIVLSAVRSLTSVFLIILSGHL
ncbi:hypothetical protein EDB92DRAFT_1136953 [Lactarius akahatsu]|uniref:Uncharacterized protein n=1 Tax=Lactarius akahatsu TaxID=416441 RepID=A0AAD4LDC6_9AGAM|nr:hypothetical protein EDB92DRAFT_1136953 [Lactarius akahatsu]